MQIPITSANPYFTHDYWYINLFFFHFFFFQNPEYIIIKRWVPAEEQKELWSLTRVIRDDREKVTTTLTIEDRSRHHHRDKSRDNLVLVRKTKRERSRSPSVLKYLAGAR